MAAQWFDYFECKVELTGGQNALLLSDQKTRLDIKKKSKEQETSFVEREHYSAKTEWGMDVPY